MMTTTTMTRDSEVFADALRGVVAPAPEDGDDTVEGESTEAADEAVAAKGEPAEAEEAAAAAEGLEGSLEASAEESFKDAEEEWVPLEGASEAAAGTSAEEAPEPDEQTSA